MVVPAAYAVPLPDALPFEYAAPLLCAGLAVFNGLRTVGFTSGAKVANIGLGGLGHLGVQYAHAMAGRVAVITRGTAKQQIAKELGVDHVIDTDETGGAPGDALARWSGGADIILATAPSAELATSTVADSRPTARSSSSASMPSPGGAPARSEPRTPARHRNADGLTAPEMRLAPLI